jgi:hypothetical protein
MGKQVEFVPLPEERHEVEEVNENMLRETMNAIDDVLKPKQYYIGSHPDFPRPEAK